jgi:hypothetical protein
MHSPVFLPSAFEYLVDTGQSSVLFLDVMRQRGVQYRQHRLRPHLKSLTIRRFDHRWQKVGTAVN